MKSKNPYLFLLGKTWEYAQDQRRNFLLCLFLLTLGQINWTFKPYILGKIFNILQHVHAGDFRLIIGWLCFYAFIDVITWTVWKPGRQIERIVAFNVRRNYFDRHYKFLKDLPLKWHQDHHSGDTINRIKTAGDSLYSFSETQFMYIIYITSFVGPLIALGLIAPKIAGMAVTGALVTLYILWLFDQKLIPLFSIENERLNKFSAVFFDYVSNIKTIITLRLGERTRGELRRNADALFPVFDKQIRIHETKYMVMTFCNAFMMTLILAFFIHAQIAQGAVAIGTTIAVFQYMNMLNNTFFGFANDYQQIVRWRTNLLSAKDIEIAHTHSYRQQDETNESDPPWNSVSIRHLNFSYAADTNTLKDISISFAKGEKIALVGESGSGKSTLLSLIRGLYEADNVELSFGGRDYKSLAPLFHLTTLIPQEPEIFENTIRYNVTVGIDCPEEDIHAALRLARFDNVAALLPKGLETDVREKGVTLSGGERQRLALARGILAAKNSEIILMDEPTSSVDTPNEMAIYDHLLSYFSERAVISSIHRLYLLNRFDRVIVMDAGRIMQDGTFDSLKKELWEKYVQAHKNEQL